MDSNEIEVKNIVEGMSMAEDLGFSESYSGNTKRLINPDGTFNIERKGAKNFSLYQFLIELSAWRFTMLVLGSFTLINLIFALAFVAIGIEELNGIPDTNIFTQTLYAFFFSVQTFTTVGYGSIHPTGIMSNMIAATCATVGLVAFAVSTGLLLARFSRPNAYIKFSGCSVINTIDGVKSFQCRVVNTRHHKINRLSAKMTLTYTSGTADRIRRKFEHMDLEINTINLFPLNWTLVHNIDESSPLAKFDLSVYDERNVEVVVMVSGYDESYRQSTHVNRSYVFSEMHCGHRYLPMYHQGKDGSTVLDIDLLSRTELFNTELEQ